MNSIDYFTPDELAQLRGSASRGVPAASDLSQSVSQAYAQKKAALAAQRLAQPVPASAPVETPAPAPVETPAPASTAKPSLGQRILKAKNIASNGLSYLTRGIGGAQAGLGAYQAATEAPTGNTILGVSAPSSN